MKTSKIFTPSRNEIIALIRDYPLAKHVLAFTARIVEVRAKFKLGQNEPLNVFEDIMRGLEGENNPVLVAAMLP